MTSFLDGSTIYGSSKEEAESLRTFSLGQLKVQYNDNYDELLGADLNSLDCRDSAGKKCFKSGDVRVNEHPGIAAMGSPHKYIKSLFLLVSPCFGNSGCLSFLFAGVIPLFPT